MGKQQNDAVRAALVDDVSVGGQIGPGVARPPYEAPLGRARRGAETCWLLHGIRLPEDPMLHLRKKVIAAAIKVQEAVCLVYEHPQ